MSEQIHVLAWDSLTPEEEERTEDPSDEEGSDEGSGSPTVDRTLSEGQEEADEGAHHGDHTGQVHSLPSGRGIRRLGVARVGVREQEQRGDDEDLRVSTFDM
jgi:hypothetical protein